MSQSMKCKKCGNVLFYVVSKGIATCSTCDNEKQSETIKMMPKGYQRIRGGGLIKKDNSFLLEPIITKVNTAPYCIFHTGKPGFKYEVSYAL